MDFNTITDDALISPEIAHRSNPRYPLPKTAVLVSSGSDFTQIIKKADPEEKPEPFLMSSIHCQGNREKGVVFAGPYVGAPYGIILMEHLIIRGVSSVIALGWCGAISRELHIGDIVIPDLACVEEGTSPLYGNASGESYAHPGLTKELRDFFANKIPSVHHGAVWTTDAIYRETPDKVEHFRKKGAVCVEMEVSAIFTVAAFRKVDAAAVLIVSDELSSGTWKPGFREQAFRESRKKAASILLDFLR